MPVEEGRTAGRAVGRVWEDRIADWVLADRTVGTSADSTAGCIPGWKVDSESSDSSDNSDSSDRVGCLVHRKSIPDCPVHTRNIPEYIPEYIHIDYIPDYIPDH